MERYDDGIPCDHPSCLSHINHPCEGCGRIAGRFLNTLELFLDHLERKWDDADIIPEYVSLKEVDYVTMLTVMQSYYNFLKQQDTPETRKELDKVNSITRTWHLQRRRADELG